MKRLLILVSCAVGCGDDGTKPPGDATEPQPEVTLTDEGGATVTELALGQANVGQNASGTLRVTNTGQGATGPIALAISGPAANDFAIDNAATTCAAKSLAGGESCDVVLQFRPTAVGSRSASLVLSSSPGGTHTVALVGFALMPDLHFNPTSLPFGQLEIGQSTQTTIEIRNDGTTAAALDALAVVGGAFTRGASTCGATLAAGTSCDVTLIATPQALGLISGNITVSSGGQDYSAPLTIRGARRITVVRQGNGTGSVSSSPTGIDCNATCTALFEGAVTLTAVPGATSAITSWSVAGCGSSASCVVPADLTPVTVDISFASTASSSLGIVFAGSATGEVRVVNTTAGGAVVCFASCSVPATPGDNLRVEASTPSGFTGFSGACTGTSSCDIALPAGTSTVTTTFDMDVKEQWTRFLPGAIPHAAAFDATGNLIVASTNKLTKLGPTGSTIWTLDMNVSALDTGPADTIYIVTGGLLKKLDAAGAELWSVTAGAVCTVGHAVSVAADGTVAVRLGNNVSRWTAAGAPSWTKAITTPSGRCSVATDASGNIVVDMGMSAGDTTGLQRFAPDSTDLGAQFALGEYTSMVSSSAAGAVVACASGHGRATLTGTTPLDTSSAGLVPNWCAAANADRAWVFTNDEYASSDPANWRAYRYNTGGVALWSLTRTRFLAPFNKYGTAPRYIAGSAAGRIAIVGHYAGVSSDTAWVQTFDP